MWQWFQYYLSEGAIELYGRKILWSQPHTLLEQVMISLQSTSSSILLPSEEDHLPAHTRTKSPNRISFVMVQHPVLVGSRTTALLDPHPTSTRTRINLQVQHQLMAQGPGQLCPGGIHPVGKEGSLWEILQLQKAVRSEVLWNQAVTYIHLQSAQGVRD